MSLPVMLIVLDGFGIGDAGDADATALAHTPFLDRTRRQYPTSKIETSGTAVGLPPGQMGNSEVGHMTMGAGRILSMDMTRITNAIARGELAQNHAIAEAFEKLAATGGRLHLLGLVSDGGVHSHQDHLSALLDFCRERGVEPVVHAFLDGRDTPPSSGLGFIEQLAPRVARAGGRIATVIGRYFAMDRDNRWERVGRAYSAMVLRRGHEAPDAISAVRAAYARGETDEFVQPTVIAGGAAIADGDVCFCFNYRADRAREITNALTGVLPERMDAGSWRERPPLLASYLCLTEYDAEFGLPVVFPSETPRQILGEVLAELDLAQLRIAETEKYAHVTFFFNGGIEEPFPGEERVLIPSPRDVATYDHKPEMSAYQVTEAVVERIRRGDYAFILLNFANPDMVGHTGVLDAAIKAVETIDKGLEKICDAVLARGGSVLITADHGNCELMVDPETGQPHTAHTTNPVPLFWIAANSPGRTLRDGGLADIAPTVLELLEIPKPAEMTGHSLIAS
jgi:2,3-bisphosphoglycerate-independent phosphoglycerate mutase